MPVDFLWVYDRMNNSNALRNVLHRMTDSDLKGLLKMHHPDFSLSKKVVSKTGKAGTSKRPKAELIAQLMTRPELIRGLVRSGTPAVNVHRPRNSTPEVPRPRNSTPEVHRPRNSTPAANSVATTVLLPRAQSLDSNRTVTVNRPNSNAALRNVLRGMPDEKLKTLLKLYHPGFLISKKVVSKTGKVGMSKRPKAELITQLMTRPEIVQGLLRGETPAVNQPWPRNSTPAVNLLRSRSGTPASINSNRTVTVNHSSLRNTTPEITEIDTMLQTLHEYKDDEKELKKLVKKYYPHNDISRKVEQPNGTVARVRRSKVELIQKLLNLRGPQTARKYTQIELEIKKLNELKDIVKRMKDSGYKNAQVSKEVQGGTAFKSRNELIQHILELQERGADSTGVGGRKQKVKYEVYINGKKHSFDDTVITAVANRLQSTKENAARHLILMRKNNPPKTVSGWGIDNKMSNTPRSYLLWNDDKKMHRLTREDSIHRIQSYFPQLTNREAAERYLNSSRGFAKMRALEDGERGYFDYRYNKYISANKSDVPGPEFMEAYKKYKKTMQAKANKNKKNNNNAESNTTNTGNRNVNYSISEDVFAMIQTAKIIEEAKRLERLRSLVDEKCLKDAMKNGSIDVKILMKTLFGYGGELEKRPLLTGNVGTPGDERSPLQQLQDAKGNGCTARNKRWPKGQGASLEVHQAVVYIVCSLVARGLLRQPGLLAMHSVGAGKFFELLSGIIAFWNTTDPSGKPWGIFPASVRSNFAGNNNLAELARGAILLFPWFRSTVPGLEEYPFSAGEIQAGKQIIARLRIGHASFGGNDMPHEHLLGSFSTLAHDFYGYKQKKGYLDINKMKRAKYCVFLCDEIQMLFSPPSSEQGFENEYKQFRRLLISDRDPATTFVLALTATPGDTVEAINSVLECVKGATAPENNARTLTGYKGLISVAYVSGDKTKFPAVKIEHECISLADAGSSAFGGYKNLYVSTIMKFAETRKSAAELVSGYNESKQPEASTSKYTTYDQAKRFLFLSRVRRAGEWLRVSSGGVKILDSDFGDDEDNEDNNYTPTTETMQVDDQEYSTYERMARDPESNAPVLLARTGYENSTRASRGVAEQIPRTFCIVISPKIIGILNSCVRDKGVHYVFAMDWMTLRFIAFMLRTRYGFEQYAADHKLNKSSKMRFGFINPVNKIKTSAYNPLTQRFESLHEPMKIAGGRYTVQSLLGGRRGDGTRIQGALKSQENANGEVCKVILATKESYKGVDVAAVRHLHCVSSMPDWTDLLQLVGRGMRNCGHAILPKNQWTCTVHLWQLVGPGGMCSPAFPDCHIFQRALQTYARGYERIEKQLMDSSIDQELFKTYAASFQELYDALKKSCSTINSNIKPIQTLLPPQKNSSLYLATARDGSNSQRMYRDNVPAA